MMNAIARDMLTDAQMIDLIQRANTAMMQGKKLEDYNLPESVVRFIRSQKPLTEADVKRMSYGLKLSKA